MAKRNAAVEATLTLPGVTRPVGRPRKPDALSNSQRQKAFRDRKKSPAGHTGISVTCNENSSVAIAAKLSAKQLEVLRFVSSTCRNGWSPTLGGTGQIGRLNSGLSLVRLGLLSRGRWSGFSVTEFGRQCLDALTSNGN